MSELRPAIDRRTGLAAIACAALLAVGCGEYEGGSAESALQQDLGGGAPSGLSQAEQVAAFETTVHPLLTQHCDSCHEPGGQGVPKFAVADPTTAYSALVNNGKVNFSVPSSSRISMKLLQPHNCWSDCQDDADEMTAAVVAWVSAIEAAGGGTGETLAVDGITSDTRNIVTHGEVEENGERYTNNIVALWEFKDGEGATVAQDTSGVEPAMDLQLEGATMMASWGIDISEDGYARASQDASRKLYDHIADPENGTDQYTVEVWVSPSNITQGDDARVVTYSRGGGSRNFSLLQNMYTYGARNRSISPTVNGNGNPQLDTYDGDEDAQATLQHVVLTFDQYNGRRIYVDGMWTDDVDETPASRLWNWATNHRLTLGNEWQAERPWMGQIRFLAIYEQALTDEQVQKNFLAGVGKRSKLAFDVSEWAGAGAEMTFSVSSLDDHHYLFCQPIISGPNVSGLRVKNMRIAVNGNAPSEMGQAFTNLDTPVLGGEVQLSRGCTMVETQLGEAQDQFELVFEELGFFADPEEPEILDYEVPTFAYEPGDMPPTNGMRDFARVNETMGELTGVDPVETEAVYRDLEQQLPSDYDARAFVSSHQVGISKLALEYCDAMVEDPTLRDAFFGTGFAFDQDPSVAFAGGSAEITAPLVDRMMGEGLLSQPDVAAIETEIDALIGNLMATCDATECAGGARTRNIVKGACTAMLSSAAVMVH